RSIKLDLDEKGQIGKTGVEKDEIAEEGSWFTDSNPELSQLEWHKLTSSELYSRLDTNPSTGLTTLQVQTRLAQYGRNVPSAPPSTLLKRLFIYCFGGFGALLLVGGTLCILSRRPLGELQPSAANLALGVVLYWYS
ncbi:hypothetical protein L211DRAFT_864079, partial [Terfezia boudieri ATCC MYA-4762]